MRPLWQLPGLVFTSCLAGVALANHYPSFAFQPIAAQPAPPVRGVAPTDSAAQVPTAVVFGKTATGETVHLYTLRNRQGLRATISTYGGVLTSLLVPDRRGQLGNVVLGFDSLASYLGQNPYFGALIGRYGNRIAKGTFTLDGKPYQLSINNPPNSLHGGTAGFNRRVWAATPGLTTEGPTLTLRYTSPAGEEGYPGTLHVQVVYTLTHTSRRCSTSLTTVTSTSIMAIAKTY
jgi:aldose 1-epimerase